MTQTRCKIRKSIIYYNLQTGELIIKLVKTYRKIIGNRVLFPFSFGRGNTKARPIISWVGSESALKLSRRQELPLIIGPQVVKVIRGCRRVAALAAIHGVGPGTERGCRRGHARARRYRLSANHLYALQLVRSNRE